MGYLFDPQKLQEIARGVLGLPHDEMVRKVAADLAQAYPGHIETREDWVFNVAGGALGYMTILHGSLSEYLLFFGSPIGTEGFSGRYMMDVYDIVLTGEMWTYTEDDFRAKTIHGPGDMAHLRRGLAKGYRLPDACWMLEYGRGVIPASLPFGLFANAGVVCLDGTTIAKTMWSYGKQAVRELAKGKI